MTTRLPPLRLRALHRINRDSRTLRVLDLPCSESFFRTSRSGQERSSQVVQVRPGCMRQLGVQVLLRALERVAEASEQLQRVLSGARSGRRGGRPGRRSSRRSHGRRGRRLLGERVARHARLALGRWLGAARDAAALEALVAAEREVVGEHRLDADDLFNAKVAERRGDDVRGQAEV